MNKRIKELAEQAGLGLRWETTSQFEAFLEKFAELIIREVDEALRQALEDLKSVLCDPRGRCCINGSDADRLVVDRSLAAIKQALANDALDRMADNERELGIQMQPEPEILGWATHHDEPMLFPTRKEAVLYCEDDEEPRPLYTSPPKRKWQGLTQQEQASVLASVPTVPFEGDWHLVLLTSIEAKLKEKNT